MAENILQLYADDEQKIKGYPITSAKLVMRENGRSMEDFDKDMTAKHELFEKEAEEKLKDYVDALPSNIKVQREKPENNNVLWLQPEELLETPQEVTEAMLNRMTEHESQLAEKANLNSVFSMANMGQDVKEAMTGGSVAVVGKDSVLTENIVDKQVTVDKMNNAIDIVRKNLCDVSKCTDGGYINYQTGLWVSASTYSETDFILIKSNTEYFANVKRYVKFYDEYKTFISGITGWTTPFTTPLNAKYVRCTLRTEEKPTYMFVEGATLPTNYISFSEVESYRLKGLLCDKGYYENKKIAFLGDSITDKSYNSSLECFYATEVCETLKATQLNYGIASSTISVGTEDTTIGNPMVNRFSEMDSSADLVIVAGGTNDWFYARCPVGDMSSRDNQTFYGALHNLCLGLKKKYPTQTIIFMTPLMRRQNSYQNPTSVNRYGKTCKQYGEIIKEVCHYYSIPTLDMYGESGLYPFDDELALLDYNQQGTDGSYYYTHPNSNGHKKMSKRLIGFLNQIN